MQNCMESNQKGREAYRGVSIFSNETTVERATPFIKLEEERVPSSLVANRVVEKAGFRNMLALEYSEIDDELICDNYRSSNI